MPSAVTFLLVGSLLAMVQWKVRPPMLLAERFLPGSGWVEAALLALYAAWLVRRMQDPRGHPVWRRRVWRLFSAVFFGQLLLGILGVERCLMTGTLHFPIPALIAAGPAWRGGGFFMLGLFLTTVVLVGPGWCSHLCYLGSWDDAASLARRRPRLLPPWTRWAKFLWAAAVIGGAWLLGRSGLPGTAAVVAAATLGIGGVAVMLLLSRRWGAMVHCLFFCPIHVLATALGRLNPFRIRIDSACTFCGACTLACRYDALQPGDLRRNRVALSCTLCGDCLPSCRDGHLAYRFPGLTPARSRTLFLVLTVSLHALFLGLARI